MSTRQLLDHSIRWTQSTWAGRPGFWAEIRLNGNRTGYRVVLNRWPDNSTIELRAVKGDFRVGTGREFSRVIMAYDTDEGVVWRRAYDMLQEAQMAV